MKSFNYVHSFLSATFTNKQAQVHACNPVEDKTKIEKNESDLKYQQRHALLNSKQKSTPHQTKPAKELIHVRSLPSLQTLFKRPKQSLLKRTHSQTSSYSTDTKISTVSSFSLKFIINNDIMEPSDSLISPTEHITHGLTPFKDSKMSKKSIEFEALIEEYPSRILKASLTPSLCS